MFKDAQLSNNKASFQAALSTCEKSNSTLGLPQRPTDDPVWINIVKHNNRNWKAERPERHSVKDDGKS